MGANDDRRSTALMRRFQGLPTNARLVAVALLGAAIGLVTYQLIYWVNPFEPRAPTSWLAAFVIGVPRQYSLHRSLTFRSDVPYAPRLVRAYLLYACIAVLTTTLNWLLVERLAVPHHLAWLACISTTGLINYFALEPLVFRTTLACGLRRSRIPSSPGASGPAAPTDGGADDETDRR
jgi:putative flippase GtrA